VPLRGTVPASPAVPDASHATAWPPAFGPAMPETRVQALRSPGFR